MIKIYQRPNLIVLFPRYPPLPYEAAQWCEGALGTGVNPFNGGFLGNSF
jgi:hypothetical protein